MKKQKTCSVLSLCSALAASLFVSSLPVFAIREDFESDDVVYRLYNPHSSEHLYSDSPTEIKALFDRGWILENVAWQSSFNGDPVYRLYNPNAAGGDHYYTASLAEARELVRLGWKWDFGGQPAFFSTGKIPVYVAYNPNAGSGSHLYTTSLEEETFLLEHGWLYGTQAWNAEKAGHPIYRDDEILEVLYPDLSELPDLPENPDPSSKPSNVPDPH